jgi:hypothetical protein
VRRLKTNAEGSVTPQLDSTRTNGSRRALAIALFTVAFGTNVSTPLLLLYQERLDLSNWTVTALFAIYPIGLIPALLWAGPASDVYGRKPLVMVGIALSAVASVVFMLGHDAVAALFVARCLLGIVSGLVFAPASAWMQEIPAPADPLWPSRLTSMVLFAGFGGGPALAGLLGQWAPWKLHLSFAVHVVLIAVGWFAVRGLNDTVEPDPTRRVHLDLGVPAEVRRPFLSVVVPTALGVFGFASLSIGLFPVLLRPAMESVAVFVTGSVGAIVAASIFLAQTVVGRIGVAASSAVGLASGALGCALGAIAFGTGWWGLVLLAAPLLGAGSGLALTAGLRFVDVLTTPASRGAMTGAFYAVAYAAMTMPVIVTTIARSRGASVTVLTVVAVLALGGALWLRRRASTVFHYQNR